jgi:WD40 repeat protein
LIAAGTYDGVVAIYDIRRKEDTPVTENKEMSGKHNDAVWEVQWVGRGNKGGDKAEALVSISSDSRVVEWSMKKGLEYTDLMNLKR